MLWLCQFLQMDFYCVNIFIPNNVFMSYHRLNEDGFFFAFNCQFLCVFFCIQMTPLKYNWEISVSSNGLEITFGKLQAIKLYGIDHYKRPLIQIIYESACARANISSAASNVLSSKHVRKKRNMFYGKKRENTHFHLNFPTEWGKRFAEQKMCQRNEPLVAIICWAQQNLWPTIYTLLYTLGFV